MASRRNRPINLPAPYLKRIWLEPSRITNREAYPFCLPLLRDDFELGFDKAITIIVGENGTGKSTLLEGIAVLAGYDEAGGGKGHRPIDQKYPMGGGPPPDFLSHSHGEGFLRFFEERCRKQGIFIFDEPESALSPSRQIAFLKLMRRMEDIGHCQIIMATHSPVLMAYPNATLLRLTKYGLEPVTVKDTDHYKVMREFCEDPKGFVDAAIAE